MFKLLKHEFNFSWIVNPFFAYCLAFVFSILLYLMGWSSIYPELTTSLLVFFLLSFIPFIIGGLYLNKHISLNLQDHSVKPLMFDIPFCLLSCLGILIFILGGYVPFFRENYNYKEFGLPVIDTLFYSLSIYLSVFYLSSYLASRSRKLLIYLLVIIVFQILLFNRYTLLWIFISALYLLIINKRSIPPVFLIIGIVLFVIASYCFGLFGNLRSSFSKEYVLNELYASSRFNDLRISHNYYITYLYISSPLANLQENLNETDQSKNRDLKNYLLYSIFPISITKRVEKPLHISPPEYNLIIPSLTAGTYFMNGCFSYGWTGMVLLEIFFILYILGVLAIIPHNSPFFIISIVLLTTTASLLIFDNFLTRMDVILNLFIYPFIFHHLQLRMSKEK